MLKQTLFSLGFGWALITEGVPIETFTAAPDQLIPDANAAGWQNTQIVSLFGDGVTVQDVKVTLNISGGYNGDLYAYLAHDGQQAVLLNRVGKSDSDVFGYADAGMNVQFTDAAANNIHTYHLSGGSISDEAQWQPDGREASPFEVTSQTAPSISASLSTFAANQTLANGSWTLFVADLSAGGQSQVNSWSLQIQAASDLPVPEPSSLSLVVLGAGVGLVSWWRRKAVRP